MKLPREPRVFITGGGSGLGQALALKLAKRGARILIGDVNLDSAGETAEAVEKLGGKTGVIKCDVTKPADLTRAADKMQELWGGIDLVVNNAGVAAGGLVGDVSLADWKWIVNINMWGVIHGCHVFVPRLKAAGKGAILNVASSAGIVALPEMASYNVTKAAVIALSETLYAELAPHNIAVSVLCPTFFKTNLMSSFRSPAERQRKLAEKMFAMSTMTAEQVAAAGIKGLERGDLIVVPQVDGKVIWAAKRLAHGLYYKQAARFYSSKLSDAFVAKAIAS